MRRFASLSMLLVSLLLLAACGTAGQNNPASTGVPAATSAPTATAAPHYSVGQTVKLPGWQITIESARIAATTDGLPTNTPGDKWLLLSIVVVNTSASSQTFNSAEYRLRGTDGTDYSTPYALPSDPSGPVVAGGSGTGAASAQSPSPAAAAQASPGDGGCL